MKLPSRIAASVSVVAVAIVATVLLKPQPSWPQRDPATVPPAWADVRAYGAVGDGKHDDTEAFKRAIASGLPVLVPAPKSEAWVVKQTLVIPSQHTVAGVGKGQSIIKYLGTGPCFTTDPDTKNRTRDVTIRDLTIIGTGNTSADGILIVRSSNATLENVQIREIGGTGLIIDGTKSGDVGQAHYAYVHNLHVVGANRIGVHLRGKGKDQGTNRHRFFFVRVGGSSDVALDIEERSGTNNFFGFSAENVKNGVRIAGRSNFFYGLQVEEADKHGVEFLPGAENNKFVGSTLARVASRQRWGKPELNAARKDSDRDPEFAK